MLSDNIAKTNGINVTKIAPKNADDSADRPLDLAIVILNYNTRELLRNCLYSIFSAQDTITLSVCVVDNGSGDGSAEMVRSEYPHVHLIANPANVGYSAGNNAGLRWFGFSDNAPIQPTQQLPRYVLLLNPDTIVPPAVLTRMTDFLDAHPEIGAAGPRLLRPDGTLDLACRRSFPTPRVSFYRMVGLSRLFPKSRRFNAYNLAYLSEEGIHAVDAVVGAYMQVRREAIAAIGLLDEAFFMYGEDLDWAKRIKDAGWQIWYNGTIRVVHVKEAASSQSAKARIDFYEAMWIFYHKHYRAHTSWLMDKLILGGIVSKGMFDVGRHLWRFCRRSLTQARTSTFTSHTTGTTSSVQEPTAETGAEYTKLRG